MNNMETIDPIEPLEPFFDMLEMLVARYGVFGIGVAMFAESAGVPFASLVVLLTAGTLILSGRVSFWAIFIASTFGITVGSVFSYMIGSLGRKLFGNVIRYTNHKSVADLDKKNDQRKKNSKMTQMLAMWEKYGNFSIFMAQLWGVSRTFISFPAGAMHVNLVLFIVYTFLGGSIFSLLAIGFSILLTGTMSVTMKFLRTLAGLSPWLLVIPVLAVGLYIYLFRYRRWLVIKSWFNKTWKKFNARFKK